MKTLLPIFLMVLTSALSSISTANAQDSDLLGIFFDESGGQSSIETTEPYQVVSFHIILLEPSHGEGIHAWECILEGRTGDGSAAMFGWDLAGEAFNAAQLPGFLVMLNAPLPPAAAVVLASGEVLVPDTETEILFYLHPYDPPSLQNPPDYGYPVTTPLYAYGEDLYQPLDWTSGCEAEPLARINDDGEDPVWSLGDLPEEIFFGRVQAGETETRDIAINNTGEVALSGQFGISGDGFMYCYLYDPGMWTTDSQWFRVEPGQGQNVRVFLNSATDEAYEGALDLTLCGETTTIVLVKQLALNSCNIDPPAIDFGEVNLYGPGPWTSSATVTNDGTLPLDLVVAEDCPDFLVEQSCSLIQPGNSCKLWVAFNPSEIGPQECVVSINDGLCEMVCSAVVVEGPPQCVISPPGWDFGMVWAGEPAQQTFEVLNAGGPQLEGQVTILESCSGFTVVEGAEPFSLAHGETHFFTVAFDPVECGFQECNISVSADCTDVELVATGLVCVISPPGWDFGMVWAGEPAQQTFEVLNVGGPQLEGQVTIPESCSGFTVVEGAEPFSLAHGETHFFTVEFDPVEWGPQECNISVSAGCEDIELLGVGSLVIGALSQTRTISAHASAGYEYDGDSESAPDFGLFQDAVGASVSWYGPFGLIFQGSGYAEQMSWFDAGGFTANGSSSASSISEPVSNGHCGGISSFTYEFLITEPTDYMLSGVIEAHNEGDIQPTQTTLTLTGPGGTVLDFEARNNTEEISESGSLSSGEYSFFLEAGSSCSGDALSSDSASAHFNLEMEFGTTVSIEDGGIDDDPEGVDPEEEVPSLELQLAVHPNPFNPRTTISFSLDHSQNVELCIFDMTGKRIAVLADRAFEAGQHSLDWAGRDLKGRAVASGTYLLRMVNDEGVAVEKMMLIR